MSLYVKVFTNFWTHRKTAKLRSLLGNDAYWIPIRLWCYAAENQPDGDFSSYEPEELCMLIGCLSNAQAMLQALHQVGFLVEMKLKDWEQYNAYHHEFSERAKKAAKARWDKENEKKGKETSNASSMLQASSIEILEYLNQKSMSSFKPMESSLKFIRGRLDETYTLDECKMVIDLKVSDWLGKKEYSQYLRPKTLFSATNFPGYLSEAKRTPLKPKTLINVI